MESGKSVETKTSEETEYSTLKVEEKRKKARLRRRGPCRKAHVELADGFQRAKAICLWLYMPMNYDSVYSIYGTLGHLLQTRFFSKLLHVVSI